MSANLNLHVYRQRDFRAGLRYDGFDDPDQLAPISPQKQKALVEFPIPGPDDEPVQIIGTLGKQIIGRTDFVPGVLHVNGAPVRVLWGSALSVPPEHRKTLMGVMLIMKAQALHPTVAASGPSQAVIPVYQKLKWIDLLIPRYILICRSRSVVDRYLHGGIKSAIVAPIVDAMLKLHRGIAGLFGKIRTRGFYAERVEKMDPQFDAILAGQRRPVSAHRSADWINWQLHHSFRADPRDQQNLYYVKDRSGKVVGYFLNKVRFHETATHRQFKNLMLGSTQDWMSFDPAVSSSVIVSLAVRELIRGKIDAIELSTDDPSLRTFLKILGFMRVGEMHMMFRAAAGSPLADKKLHDLSQWWIRPADGDSFFT